MTVDGAALEHGFDLGRRHHPWGTVLGDVLHAHRNVDPGSTLGHRLSHDGAPHDVVYLCSDALGLPATVVRVWADRIPRPVHQITYELAPGHGLDGRAGLAWARQPFDRALALAGQERTSAPHGSPVRWSQTWARGSVEVELTVLEQPFRSSFGDEAGTLRISHDLDPLHAPYVARQRARAAAWADGGEVDLIPAPELRDRRTYGYLSSVEHELAIDDDVVETPTWVASRLPPEHVAVWRHPPTGTWGFGDSILSRVVAAGAAPRIEHIRVHQARGRGWAGIGLLHTDGREKGLDALADALRGAGAIVLPEEGLDD